MSDEASEAPQSKGQIIDEAFEEGSDEAYAEMLAAGEAEPTPEELREFYGEDAEGMSDEELAEEFNRLAKLGEEELEGAEPEIASEVEGEGEVGEGEGEGVRTTTPDLEELNFDLVSEDGTELGREDITDLTLAEALDSIQVRYEAGGEERKDALSDLVRLAQRIPNVDRRITELLTQRNETATELEEAKQELEELREFQDLWQRVLADPSGRLFEQLREEYQRELVGEGEGGLAALRGGEAEAGSEAGEAEVDQDEGWKSEEAQRRGQQFFNQEVEPVLEDMAQRYAGDGTDADELAGQLGDAFLQLVAAEGRFLGDPEYGPKRIREILQVDLPQALERQGFRPSGAPRGGQGQAGGNEAGSTSPSEELAKMRKEIKMLKARIAQEKAEEAPGSGGSGAGTPGSGSGSASGLEDAESWGEVKERLRSGEVDFGGI